MNVENGDDARNSTWVARGNGLMLGRVVVTEPEFGVLKVYVKKTGRRGAQFLCEEDGAKYGVAWAVMAAYRKPGDYFGWGYINPEDLVVFRFKEGSREETASDWVAIECKGRYVGVPVRLHQDDLVQDGAWVAFRFRRWSSPDNGKERLTATVLYPLEVNRPQIIAQLVANGEMTGTDHGDIIGRLLGELEGAGSRLRPRQRAEWLEALNLLARLEDLSEDVRQLVRVLRDRRPRSSASGRPARVPPTKPRGGGAASRNAEKPSALRVPQFKINL